MILQIKGRKSRININSIEREILSKAQIFEILPVLLVIVGLFLFFGIIIPEKWKIEIPIINGFF